MEENSFLGLEFWGRILVLLRGENFDLGVVVVVVVVVFFFFCLFGGVVFRFVIL